MKKNPLIQDHCHFTGGFRGLAHKKHNLNAQKKCVSFVPIIFYNHSGYGCHFFEKLIKMATEEGVELEGDDIIAKSSENYKSVRMGCVNFLGSGRFLNAKLDEVSTTTT